MSLALIQESAKEVRRLAIAGSPLAVGDFRLKKFIAPLEAAGEDDVIFTPAGYVHGFNNTSDGDVLLLWGWRGAGSLDAAGYELHHHG